MPPTCRGPSHPGQRRGSRERRASGTPEGAPDLHRGQVAGVHHPVDGHLGHAQHRRHLSHGEERGAPEALGGVGRPGAMSLRSVRRGGPSGQEHRQYIPAPVIAQEFPDLNRHSRRISHWGTNCRYRNRSYPDREPLQRPPPARTSPDTPVPAPENVTKPPRQDHNGDRAPDRHRTGAGARPRIPQRIRTRPPRRQATPGSLARPARGVVGRPWKRYKKHRPGHAAPTTPMSHPSAPRCRAQNPPDCAACSDTSSRSARSRGRPGSTRPDWRSSSSPPSSSWSRAC